MLIGAFSCDEKEAVEVKPPTNLNFIVEVNPDQSGKVSVTATAENASFYTMYFGEKANDNGITSSTGKADYVYQSSGTFTVKVQAFGANPSLFVEKSEAVSITVNLTIPTEGYSTPTSYDGLTLVWQDEFNGPTINEADWTFETGGHGWGNEELQYYKKENAAIQDGHLVITAKQESFSGSSYTSTRMITRDKQSFMYGRIDIRALLPKGQGIWPALWMLGSSFPTAGWPKCGEIDIMEMIGGAGREKTVHGTTHWFDASDYAYYGGHYDLSTGTFADKFHVFTIIWDADKIMWYVDDVKFHEIDITPATAPERFDEFRQEFFFIFNIAVGGRWPGNPDNTTVFPQRMIVDYVRVFQ